MSILACTCCCDNEGTARDIELRTYEDEEAFRIELERRFMPLFNRHGIQGVLIKDLQYELEATRIIRTIPTARLEDLLQRANSDHDMYISYTEFMNMMTGPDVLSTNERTALNKFMEVVIANILPQSKKEDFLANYACCPPPLFMILISIAEIIVFIIYAVELRNTKTPVTATSGVPLYSPLIYKPSRRYEVWRYLTYMFIHQGYMHLIGNLIFQLVLGLPLELVNKWWRVLIVYLVGVVTGSLAHSLTDHNVALAGASGGCYALIGAHIASIVLNWAEMNRDCCDGNPVRFVLSAPVRLAALLLLAILDTSNAVYRRYYDPAGGHIGISAHMGGLACGLFLGIAVLTNINVKPWEKTTGWVTLIIFLVFLAITIFFNGLYQGFPAQDWSKCCP